MGELTNDELARKLRELSEAATPGPWFVDRGTVCIESPPGPNDEPEVMIPLFDASGYDAALIAALVTHLPTILAALSPPDAQGKGMVLDAGRYAWLRDEANDYPHDYRLRIFDGLGVMLSGDEFDAAIDAAMKEQGNDPGRT